MSDKDQPAFPMQEKNSDGTHYHTHAGMTLRQYAAIHLRVPKSGTEWLDKMIRKARRDELAGKAMQGMLVGVVGKIGAAADVSAYAGGACNAVIADRAFAIADAMLKESDK